MSQKVDWQEQIAGLSSPMKPINEMTDWEKEQAIYSARYILEDFFEMGKSGVELLAERLIVVDGVVHSALENIFAAKIGWPEQLTGL